MTAFEGLVTLKSPPNINLQPRYLSISPCITPTTSQNHCNADYCHRQRHINTAKNQVITILGTITWRYDMRKYFFTCRIINLWNSLPAHVVHASSVNDFKNKLDAYWSTQEMMYNYRAEISGTGNRSVTT